MQHVDEGQLHAYLDGELTEPGEDPREVEQHLAECAECRALLDGVRLLRESGRTLLADPLPVEPPPFDAVIARSRRPAPRPAGAGRRVAPLAWAASLVVALGAGWLARDLLRGEEGAPGMEMAASMADSADPPAAAPEVLASAAAAADATEAAREAAPVPEGAAATVGPGAPPLAPQSAAAPSAPTGQAATDGVVAAGYGTERRAEPGAAAEQGETMVAMAPAPAPPTVAADRVEAIVPTAAAPAPATVARATAARTARAQAFAAPVAEQAGWAVVDRSTAEQALGAPIALVPALPVLGFELSVAGAGPTVRVRQRLPGGELLTLLAQRVAAATGEAVQARTRAAGEIAGLESARGNVEAQATRRVGDVVLSARAAIPADSLQALLAKAR